MPTNIRIRRGKKANLPSSAPSGMPLWCEDTKELYIGTGSGIQIIHTYDADTVDGYHASSFLQSSKQFKIASGANTGTTTYVYPPDGYAMSNLVAFIPSIRVIHYNGDVDNNDSMPILITYAFYRFPVRYTIMLIEEYYQADFLIYLPKIQNF